MECKIRKSRDTWSNRQVWPWSTKWSRTKSNKVLPRDCTGYSERPLPTTWDNSTHEHHQMVNTEIRLTIFFARDRETIQLAKTRPGTDCGSGLDPLIAKVRMKLKKVGKTTRPFRYNLNKIPCYYTVEVRNRFNELELIECLKNCEQKFVTLYRRQCSRKNKCKKAK